ncbi:pentatricopeptide repeat-containing protein At5g66631 [Elaeis guineensis]|uniref:pentatricopeptide repeat-containing protein At5g66631 n=1 Tax=Elaeis guineensis var. tenera TaxID=51953 RepID=UPI003C6CCB23
MPSLHPFLSSIAKRQTLTLSISAALLRSFSYSAKPSAAAGETRVSLYFRRARLIDTLRLRLRLRSHDPSASFPLPSSPALDPFVAANALRAAPSPAHALALFHSFLSHPAVARRPAPALHALAKRLALARRLPDLHQLLADLDAGVFPSALPPSPMDRLRWLAAAGDLPSALHAWASLRSSASSSGRRGRSHPCTEAYNLIMNLYASTCDHSAAVATFNQMIQEGANPNSRTYTIIIDHLIRSGNLDHAIEVFHLLPSMRIRRTSKQYNVLAEALSSSGRFVDLEKLIKAMNSDGILPGRSMREAISRMREAGHTTGTEEFVKILFPDARIGIAVEEEESEEETDEEPDKEEDSDDNPKNDGSDQVKLKPWLDPIALAKALEDWDPAEVSELEAAKLVWTSRLVCKLLRAFKKAETAWEFFCWVAYQPGGFAHDRDTVARMIAILARNGHVELVERLLSKVKSEGILLPFDTVRLVVDFYGLSKKADAAVKVFRDANSICGSLSESNRLLLCSSLLRTMAKCRRRNEAMELLEEMMLEGVLPDIQTFTGLMQYFAGNGDLKSVHRLFGMVRQCRLEPDSYMYRVLIRAYCKQERAALALRMFEEMRSSRMLPDGHTKALLVKSLWKEGKLREAALVEERCEEVQTGLPSASPGHVWTVSAVDFERIYDIYSGCFAKRDG